MIFCGAGNAPQNPHAPQDMVFFVRQMNLSLLVREQVSIDLTMIGIGDGAISKRQFPP
jgi:hypothetical protein